MKFPMRSQKNTPSQGQMGDVPVGSEITFEVRTAGCWRFHGDFMGFSEIERTIQGGFIH